MPSGSTFDFPAASIAKWLLERHADRAGKLVSSAAWMVTITLIGLSGQACAIGPGPQGQCAAGGLALISAIDVAISDATSLIFPGTIIVLFFCARWP